MRKGLLRKKSIPVTSLKKILTFSFITNAGKIAASNRVVKCGETNRHPCVNSNITSLKTYFEEYVNYKIQSILTIETEIKNKLHVNIIEITYRASLQHI
jgi:hypothetical protein